MHQDVKAFPLTWPLGWKRTPDHQRPHSNFGTKRYGSYGKDNVTFDKASRAVLKELQMMGVHHGTIVISGNLKLRVDGLPYSEQKNPDDPGMAVWWTHKNKQHVIAIDRYYRAADNLYAIAKTLEAMRGIKRWGSGEILDRTYASMAPALPNLGSEPWHTVLGVQTHTPTADVEAAYKKLRNAAHPDKPGGSDTAFNRIQRAWEDFSAERGL